MPWSIDARVPVAFRAAAAFAPEVALLLEGDRPAPEGAVVARFSPDLGQSDLAGHGADCACCVPRGAVAQALGQLFLARARGEVSFFRSVIVVCGAAGHAEVLAALATDPVVSARFRLAE
ncbi:MAG TPA: hypothetical protein VLJ20_05055 [Acetobacteraceae bacterium]|nr:hypothetical protein [Acetobacteraceae bacterium]